METIKQYALQDISISKTEDGLVLIEQIIGAGRDMRVNKILLTDAGILRLIDEWRKLK